jgi:Glyoxalase-like domain
MHHSRLCAVLIDCKTSNVDQAAHFWGEALGRAVDLKHAGSRGNYRMLQTPPDEPIVQIQRVDHESRVHIDIESDDIPAEVARLEKLGAKVGGSPGALDSDAGAHWPAVLRRQGAASRLPEERQSLGLKHHRALACRRPSMVPTSNRRSGP